jgi:hypothetical protein
MDPIALPKCVVGPKGSWALLRGKPHAMRSAIDRYRCAVTFGSSDDES